MCTWAYFIVRASMDSFVDLNLACEKFENCTEDLSESQASMTSVAWMILKCIATVQSYERSNAVPMSLCIIFYFNAQKLTPYSFSGFQLSTAGWPILKVWLMIFPLPTPPPLRAKGIWQMWWSWCALEFWRDRVTLISDDICKLSNAVSTDKSRSFRLVPQWRVARYPGKKCSAWIVGKK